MGLQSLVWVRTYDVTSGNDILPCIKLDKPQMVYWSHCGVVDKPLPCTQGLEFELWLL